ncbi:nuclear transport factor 2 family protein [Bradyrhizobium oligotrophicum]|uniref:nuclear transport factor 2 family protein n=1 Tax=Bradyrhizobium oligotrophicum TaxID=44255 RepID=UPI003EC0BB9C
MIVVVVIPSKVIETSLTTVLPDDEPPLPEELSDVLLDELAADDVEVVEVEEVAVVVGTEVMGVVTELIDMGVSREEGPCRASRAARFFNAAAARSWRDELRPNVSRRCPRHMMTSAALSPPAQAPSMLWPRFSSEVREHGCRERVDRRTQLKVEMSVARVSSERWEGAMANRDELLERVRRAYKARDAGALDDLMAEFHPDAVFTLAGDNTTTAMVGCMRGHCDIRQGVARLIDTFEFVQRQVLAELVDQDRVVVHSRAVVRSQPTKMTRETDILDLFRIRDGKIVEFLEFADTALIKAMVS